MGQDFFQWVFLLVLQEAGAHQAGNVPKGRWCQRGKRWKSDGASMSGKSEFGMCGQGKGDLYEVLLSQSGQDMFSGVWFCTYQPGDDDSILMGKRCGLHSYWDREYPVLDVGG